MRRKLNLHEVQLAQQVFQNRLPYGAISVSSALGFRGRPYTLNFMALDDEPTSVLHVGPGGFAGLELSPYWKDKPNAELHAVQQTYDAAWATL